MTASSGSHAIAPMHLTLLQKGVAWLAWFTAGAVFLTIGWFAMAPDDPLGAVSLLSRNDWVIMWIGAAALACVASGVATVLAGRLLPDAGTFAAALGLTTVSLRAGTADELLADHTGAAAGAQRALAANMLAESLAWILVAALAVVTCALAMRILYGRRHAEDASGHDPAAVDHGYTLAGYDLPGLGGRRCDSFSSVRTDLRTGLQYVGVATGLGLIIMAIMHQGLGARTTRHGQACFVVAVSVFVSALVANRVFPVRSALWSILSAWLMVILAYAWAIARPTGATLPPTGVHSNFLRVLPIQFVAVGTAVAVAAFWYMRPSAPRPITQDAARSRQPSSRKIRR